MVSNSTSQNSGSRPTVFSNPMTDWNALLRLSLFTLFFAIVGNFQANAQCSIMVNNATVMLTVDNMGDATLDMAALSTNITVTGGCSMYEFSDSLGNPVGTMGSVALTCQAAGPGAGTYFLRVTDGIIFSTLVQLDVVLVDIDDPTFTTPGDITVSCSVDRTDLSMTNGDVMDEADNCAMNIQATYTDDESGLTGCNMTGVVVRTWTLDDGNGNVSTDDQMITVQDVTPPTFTVPMDVTIDFCGDDINDLSLTGDVTDEMDNCDLGPLTATYADGPMVAGTGTCPNESTVERTWTLTDACSQATVFMQTITLMDMTAPQLTMLAPDSVEMDNGMNTCDAMITLVLDDTHVTDNCDAFTNLTITNNSIYANVNTADASGTYPVGTTTVVFTIADQCMNSTTHSVDVVVTDTMPPMITGCPMDIVIDNDPGNCDNFVSWTAPTSTDNCPTLGSTAGIVETITVDDASVIINMGTPGVGRVDGADFPVGTSVVTYAFLDTNGVPDTCQFSVTVRDVEAPVLTCPADQTLNFGGCNAANVFVPDYRSLLSVFDNCSNGFTVVQTPAPFDLLSTVPGVTPLDNEPFTVTFTVTDNNAPNLSNSCSFIVTLNEDGSIVPTIPGTNLPSINNTCGPVDVCAPTAIDECGNLLVGTPNPGAGGIQNGTCLAPCTPNPDVLTTHAGPIADNNFPGGNNFNIVVSGLDTIVETLDIGIDISHTFIGDINGTLTSPNGTTINLFERINGGDCGGDGLDVTFSDSAPNSSADFFASCNGQANIIGDYEPLSSLGAFQGEDPNGTWVLNLTDNAQFDTGTLNSTSLSFCTNTGATIPSYTFPNGSRTVTWSYVDATMNTATQLQLIEAADDTDGPVFNCEDITISLDDNGMGTVDAESVIGGGIQLVSSSNFSFGNGFSNYCYTATTASTISFNWDYETLDSSSDQDPFVYFINLAGLTYITPFGSTALTQSGSQSISIEAGDELCLSGASLNGLPPSATTLISSLTVNGAPYDPADWTTSFINSSGSVTVIPAQAMDNCGVDFSTLTIDGGSSWAATCSDLGTNALTVSLFDINGNESTCTVNVTVEDLTAPTLTNVANDTTVTCGNIPAVITPTVSDNCSTGLTAILNTTSTQSGNPNTCSNYTYQITRTWSTTDNAGNLATAVQVVSVEDNDAPTNAVFSDNIGIDDKIGTNAVSCDATIALALTSAMDCAPFANLTITNNSIYAIAGGADASGTYPVGPHNVNFEVTDPCGNTVSFNRVFTVTDDVSPIAICKSVTLGLPSNGNLTLLPGFINDGSTDNCSAQGDLVITVSPTDFDCSHADGVTQWPVTLTVTDENLNSATCTSFVVIQDNFAPTVNCNDITVELDQNSMASITVADINNGSFDNCTATADLIYSLSNTTFTQANVGPSGTGINQVTLSVEDSNGNVGTCIANVTVTIPVPCFEVGSAAGPSGTTVTVPISVSNFTNVGSFQFFLVASDPSILDITTLTATSALGFGNFSFNEISDDSIRVSYSIPGVPLVPINLADGTVIINVDVLLTGMVSDSSSLNIMGDDLNGFPITVDHFFNGSIFQTVPCITNGGVLINAPASLTIAGDVFTETGAPIALVDVSAIDGMSSVAGMDQTGTDGIYNISPVFSGDDYVIAPSKDINWTNGVTPFDLATIQQHIVGIDTLDSSYKKIAADAFKDNVISTFDVLQLQILLASAVGGPSAIIPPPTQTSWVFVPALDTPDVNNQLGPLFVPLYSQTITIANLMTDSLDNDFIGVKIGDVTGNVDPTSLTGSTATDRGLNDNSLITSDLNLEAGNTVTLPFHFEKTENWIAGQWVLEFDTDVLELLEANPISGSAIKSSDFGTQFLSQGKMSIINFDAVARTTSSEDQLFELVFQVKADAQLSEVLSIDESVLESNLYAVTGEATALGLGFTDELTTIQASGYELLQNRPNPFVDETYIGFSLPEAAYSTITISDISGRIITVIEQDFAKGYNEIKVSRNELPENGVFIYRLESKDFSAVKKMTLLSK